MWWCCGKPGLQAIGCRFSKHESKDDEEDLDYRAAGDEEKERVLLNLHHSALSACLYLI